MESDSNSQDSPNQDSPNQNFHSRGSGDGPSNKHESKRLGQHEPHDKAPTDPSPPKAGGKGMSGTDSGSHTSLDALESGAVSLRPLRDDPVLKLGAHSPEPSDEPTPDIGSPPAPLSLDETDLAGRADLTSSSAGSSIGGADGSSGGAGSSGQGGGGEGSSGQGSSGEGKAGDRQRKSLPIKETHNLPIDGGKSQTWKRVRLLLVYPLAAALLASAVGVGVAASIQRPEVAEIDSFVPLLVTEVYAHDGEVVRTYSRENRILLQEGELPEVLSSAILATEDSNFFQHGGIDLKGVARAMVTNVKAGRIKEGASTITMQLARALFSLTREQDWWRKIEEAFLAVELEKHYSKQQILTMYANLVNLGHGNYGMEAAAQAFFNKPARQLSLAEAATLAGIPQRPTYFSVYRRPEAVVKRRDWVLQRMLDEGYIDRQQFEAATAQPLLVATRREEKEIGRYFTEDVRRHLIDTYGASELYDRGLRVYTTLNPTIQAAAEKALHDKLLALDHAKGWRGVPGQLEGEDLEAVALPSWSPGEPRVGEWFEGIVLEAGPKTARIQHRDTIYELDRKGLEWTGRRQPDKLLKRGNVAWFELAIDTDKEGEPEEGAEPYLRLQQEPELEGAVLVIESATGAIRAMVGGWSFERNEFNRATQAKRQVGSAFKPFVFGAALENGWTAADVLFDGPAVFEGSSQSDLYSPRNYHRRYYGILTLRQALEKSVNVSSVKLLDLVGIDNVIEFARRCGVRSDLPPYPSLALGSADLTPLELAASYAAIANQGVYVEPYTIERITARDGRAIYDHLANAHKAMDPEVAHVLTSMLRGVSLRGTAAGHLARQPIATGGKTGTTNSYTDAWFVGFTPRYTLLSWVGYDQNRSIGRNMTGAAAALPIWEKVLESGLEEGWLEEGEAFAVPPGIVTATIEPSSGLLWSELAPRGLEEVFVEGTAPDRRYDQEWARIMALPWYLQEAFYLPKEGERMPSQIADWSAVQKVWRNK